MTMTAIRTETPPLADVAPKPRITFFLPGLAMGGAERHTLQLRAALRDRGYPTEVLIYGRRRSESMLGMEGGEDAVFLDRKGMSDILGWVQAHKALSAQRADVIFGINQTPAIVASLLRIFGGTHAKVACIFHTTLLRPSEERRLFMFRAAARLFDAMVYVSRNQERFWTERGLRSRRQLAITNGVDMTSFQPTPETRAAVRGRFGLAPQDFVIGLVAAFRPEKNHIQLVEAAAKLIGEGVALKLLFIGDGPTRAGVEERARQLGLEDAAIFAGEQKNVAALLPALDVGVLCSTAVETFSLAALELLSSGVPMIMSDIGGASEIVTDGVNGYLFPAGDVDALADRLRRLADPAHREELRGRARASVEGYSLGRMLDDYEALVNALANARR